MLGIYSLFQLLLNAGGGFRGDAASFSVHIGSLLWLCYSSYCLFEKPQNENLVQIYGNPGLRVSKQRTNVLPT